jgi:hypothetical protein
MLLREVGEKMKKVGIGRSLGALALAVVAIFGLAACGDAGVPAVSTPTAAPTSTVAVVEPTMAPTEDVSGGWQTFTSEEAGFAIDMPGEPQASNQSTDSPLGQITFYFYQLSVGNAHYAVSYNDYPVPVTDLDIDELLMEGINGAAQGSEVQNVKKADVQGQPGIEGEINGQGVTHVWYKGVMVDARLYQVIFTAPEGERAVFDNSAHKFIDSFALIGR